MKKLFIGIIALCLIPAANASAIGPRSDLFGYFMSMLKNDADDERDALRAQYRRSQSRAIEQEPDVTAQAFISGDRRIGYIPPRRGSPRLRRGTSHRIW